MGISYSDKIKKLNYKKYNSAIKNFLKKHGTKIITLMLKSISF